MCRQKFIYFSLVVFFFVSILLRLRLQYRWRVVFRVARLFLGSSAWTELTIRCIRCSLTLADFLKTITLGWRAESSKVPPTIERAVNFLSLSPCHLSKFGFRLLMPKTLFTFALDILAPKMSNCFSSSSCRGLFTAGPRCCCMLLFVVVCCCKQTNFRTCAVPPSPLLWCQCTRLRVTSSPGNDEAHCFCCFVVKNNNYFYVNSIYVRMYVCLH